MPRDRLAALKACQDIPESNGDGFTSIELADFHAPTQIASVPDDGSGLGEFYREVEELTNSIESLGINVERVKRTHSHILSSPQVEDEVKQNLESTMKGIQMDANRIKARLKQMSSTSEEIGQQAHLSAEHRIRTTQHQMLTRKFIEVMTDYQLTQADYRDKCKARIQRELEITGRMTTDDEIEEMIESGNPAIFTRGIIMETQQAKQSLAEIEARHSDIMKLEKSIRELRDLFVDLATMVETQGEMVNRIENHVAQSKSHVDKARVEVNQAIAYRSKARVKKIICLTILILIVIGVVLSVVYV